MSILSFGRSIVRTYNRVVHIFGGRATQSATLRNFNTGRTSTDTGRSGLTGFKAVIPPRDHESLWRIEDLDTNNLDLYTPKELLDMLIDISPEISRAVWDFQRLCNPGYECKVYKPNSELEESEQGKAHIDEFLGRLRDLYGSVDIVIGRYFIGAFLRGAFCAELVLGDDGKTSVDLVAPDPYSIRFRKVKDSTRGEVWQPGQWQENKFIPLDIPTFRYLPVDPAPASPYGRSLAAPALFTALFIMGLLHDVKRVVMQQGYKRLVIKLNTEQAMDNYAYDPQGFKNLSEYIVAAIAAVKSMYADLQPDDALVMTDMFDLDTPAGTIDSDSIGAIDKILQRLEKSITRALKSNSLLMDNDNSTSETDSNRRWEMQVAGIKSVQHHCENMLESLLQVSLQAAGIQGRVVFRFAELRAAEMFRDEQTRALRIQNSRNEYEAGFVSQHEAANSAVNHDADMEEPRKPLVALEFTQDNNAGNEALNQGSDDRYALIPSIDKGFYELQKNGENGHV